MQAHDEDEGEGELPRLPPNLTPWQAFDAIEELVGNRHTWATPVRAEPFDVRVDGTDIIVTPHSTGKPRRITMAEVGRVIRRWQSIDGNPRVIQFLDDSQNASYLCTLLAAAVRRP